MIAAVDNSYSPRWMPARLAMTVTRIATPTAMMYSRVKIRGMLTSAGYTAALFGEIIHRDVSRTVRAATAMNDTDAERKLMMYIEIGI